jgi:hypothetical protein
MAIGESVEVRIVPMTWMTQLARASLLLATVSWIPGCVIGRYVEGNEIREEWIADLLPGVTTKDQVLEWFGPPENFSSSAALSEFLESRGLAPESAGRYPFTDVFAYQFHRGRLRGFFALLYNRFEFKIASDLLLVFFDEQGRVADWGYRDGTQGLD